MNKNFLIVTLLLVSKSTIFATELVGQDLKKLAVTLPQVQALAAKTIEVLNLCGQDQNLNKAFEDFNQGELKTLNDYISSKSYESLSEECRKSITNLIKK
jgi:hypothetical protein